MRPRPLLLAVMLAAALLCSCGQSATRILFLGNSLTYVGNLPLVLEALCSESRTPCRTEMIAEGGATLTQRVADQSLDRIAKAGSKFDYLVLQERGGDYIGAPLQVEAMKQARSAAVALVKQSRTLGMKPLLLGTYQSDPRASQALVEAEAQLATDLQVAHVAVSGYFLCGRQHDPALRWVDADGMHPGPGLSLLMAVLLYKQVFGKLPQVAPLIVQGAIYGPRNGPRATGFASAQTAAAGIARTVAYDPATVQTVVELVGSSCP